MRQPHYMPKGISIKTVGTKTVIKSEALDNYPLCNKPIREPYSAIYGIIRQSSVSRLDNFMANIVFNLMIRL